MVNILIYNNEKSEEQQCSHFFEPLQNKYEGLIVGLKQCVFCGLINKQEKRKI